MRTNLKKYILFLSFLAVSYNGINSMKLFKKLTGKDKAVSFEAKLKNVEIIEDLQDLLNEAVESKKNISAFTDKIEEFVNVREDDELDSLRTIINYAMYKQEAQKYKSIIERLRALRTRASNPMTPSEKIKILQLTISKPQKISELRENPQSFLNKLTTFVAQRTNETKDALSNLLNAVRIRKIFLNPEHEDQLTELIEIVPQPVSFYERVLLLSIQLPEITIDEAEDTAKSLIAKFDKQKDEIKNKSKEKIIYILNVMLYNPQFSTEQKQWAKETISKFKEKDITIEKEPKKYSDKILFFYNKTLDPITLTDDEQRADLLSGLAKLTKSKLKGTSTDLQILSSTLNFLKKTGHLSDLEKIQVGQLIAELKEETSVSDIISKIYSLLSKAETDISAKNDVIKLVLKAMDNLITQIKKDKKVPDEQEMVENLLALYILDSATYAANKSAIEKKQKELNKAIESTKKVTDKITDKTKSISKRTRGRLDRFRRGTRR